MRTLLALLGVLLLMASALGGAAAQRPKKVVFLAGTKSHGPGDHEYERGLRLLARCLESAPNARGGFRTEVHTGGWPADPRTLEDADAVVLFSDGSDLDAAAHPLLAGDRLETLGRAMRRGAGLVLLHYATFAPVKRGGPEYLEWAGGFFDYESGSGTPPWYSKIRHAQATCTPAAPAHPVLRGVDPFPLREEFYYRMRTREPDPRRTPLLTVALPGEEGPQMVAWAVQRADGGRGFAYTGGHFHANWKVEPLRRMVLNAIAWSARGEVPEGGIRSEIAAEDRSVHALVITGHQHPAHDWRATTPALQEALQQDPRSIVSVIEDPERLAREELWRYDVLVLNYNNWQRPTLGEAARARLLEAVRGGKGLVLVHFANGAWLDWPEFRRLSRRTWIEGTSGHDPHGPFRVEIRRRDHPVTHAVTDYDTTDELYFRQQGDLPAEPLVTARSKVTGKDEPLAFVYDEGGGRVLQCLLGHDAAALRTPGTARLYRQGAYWAARAE